MRYQFGDCTFDPSRDEVRRSGEVIPTSPQALVVLRYLLEHRDRVVSRDELIEQCWPNRYVSDATLTSCLRRARQAIGQTRTGQTLIATQHRRGYQFVAEVTELAERDPVQGAESLAPRRPLPSGSVVTPERRHLTVLSCTLAAPMHLNQPLDPEDHYDLMQTVQATTLTIITPYEGYMAPPVDDGVLVYFGYPQAHEDDAQRAVRSGLALVEALAQTVSSGLVVGIGIDSGIVIVSSGTSLAVQPSLAVGNPVARAGRLGELARPGTVVISEATAELVDGYFDCKAFRAPGLAGQLGSQLAYEMIGESALQSRLEIGMARGLTPLVGREAELALLRERWTYVQDGMGQVVVLRGEAGIGKSRLVQALKEQIVGEQLQPVVCRCSSYHQHTMLHPLIDVIQRALKARLAASRTDHLETLEALLSLYPLALDESVPLLAHLLSLPVSDERYPPLSLTPQQQRERTLDLLATLLVTPAAEAPMVFIVEDLHWADPSTLEFLELLIGQAATTALLVVLTSRPMFEAPWRETTWMTSVTLNRLTRPQNHQMITQVAGGKTFSAEVTEQLAQKADGVPLFVEELTRMVLETGQFEETDTGYELVGELSQLAIPSTLHDSLMSRLDRLGSAKEIAQWGAVLGREFTYELIQKVMPHEETELQAGLGRLVESELVFQRGLARQAHYRFKHALVQDIAYQSLRRHMRQDCHQRVAQVLAADFPEMMEAQPELLAHHYTEAGQHEAAVTYWQRAGQRALQRSANPEAIAHLMQGVALLTTLPETPERRQQELDLQAAVGPALIATKGYGAPDVERAYARAWELCQQMEDSPHLIPVLRGLSLYYRGRGDLQTAFQLGEHLLRLAQDQPDPAFLMQPHFLLGLVLFYRGEPASAQMHHRQVLAIYDPQVHHGLDVRFADLGVVSRSFLAWELWYLGYPDQALQHSQAARTLAQEVSHPFSLALALFFSAFLHQWRREVPAVHEQAAAVTTLATEQEFAFWVAYGTILHGWAQSMQGQGEQGITKIRQSLAAALDTGAKLWEVYFLGLLAEAYGDGGHPEAGLPLLAEAMAVMDAMELRFYGSELYRLKGVLLLKQAVPDASEAETCFQQALDVAREQQAKSWELRAATCLARLWQSQNKRQEAYNLLAPVYEWFTEGFDTADLQEAKTLLLELAN